MKTKFQVLIISTLIYKRDSSNLLHMIIACTNSRPLSSVIIRLWRSAAQFWNRLIILSIRICSIYVRSRFVIRVSFLLPNCIFMHFYFYRFARNVHKDESRYTRKPKHFTCNDRYYHIAISYRLIDKCNLYRAVLQLYLIFSYRFPHCTFLLYLCEKSFPHYCGKVF